MHTMNERETSRWSHVQYLIEDVKRVLQLFADYQRHSKVPMKHVLVLNLSECQYNALSSCYSHRLL